ncbi:MAG: hypothetical protein M3198_03360, partial [Actinomycetota bacterium]|nr:hypothetical protein [Actinomycetota bacterium]
MSRRRTSRPRRRAGTSPAPSGRLRDRRLWAAALLTLGVVVAVIVSRSGSGGIDTGSLYFIAPPVEVGRAPQAVSVGEGGVWVTNGGDGTVSFLDPESGEVVGDPIEVGSIPSGIAAGAGAVWVGFGEGSTAISRIDPQTREIDKEDIEIGRAPSSVAVSEDAVWVAALVGDVVARVEPTTGEVEERLADDALGFPSTVATGLGSV